MGDFIDAQWQTVMGAVNLFDGQMEHDQQQGPSGVTHRFKLLGADGIGAMAEGEDFSLGQVVVIGSRGTHDVFIPSKSIGVSWDGNDNPIVLYSVPGEKFLNQ